MLYVLSDPHLSLACDKPMDVFGSRWQDHAERLAENWKLTVGRDDTVVLPGDISWGMTLPEAKEDLKFINELPGHKIIGKGNHDYWWDTLAALNRFKSENCLDTLEFLYNNALYSQGKIICGTRGWLCEETLSGADLKIVHREAQRLEISLKAAAQLKKNCPQAEILPFMHFPPATPFACQQEIFDLLKEYGVKRLYYGHLHGPLPEGKLCRAKYGITLTLASADRLNFAPLKID